MYFLHLDTCTCRHRREQAGGPANRHTRKYACCKCWHVQKTIVWYSLKNRFRRTRHYSNTSTGRFQHSMLVFNIHLHDFKIASFVRVRLFIKKEAFITGDWFLCLSPAITLLILCDGLFANVLIVSPVPSVEYENAVHPLQSTAHIVLHDLWAIFDP